MRFSTDFPRLYADTCCTGVIRASAEDFQVDEMLDTEFTGEGEHLYVQVWKRNQNTQWIAKQLAQVADVKPQDVAYAGLKDRYAVTTQWFSLWLPGKEDPVWDDFENEDIRVLQSARHSRKLKRGGHNGNRFNIIIRDLQVSGDLVNRLERLQQNGVPNYFGEQRFGIDNGNLDKADDWFQDKIRIKNRQQKSFCLSAARSFLFNLQLAERIKRGCLGSWLEGDILIEEGSTQLSPFTNPEDVQQKLKSLDVHPTALLPGRGRTLATADSLQLEQQSVSSFSYWCEALEKKGLVNERRATRIALKTLHWQLDSDQLLLQFDLPVGCFATSVLREICDYQNRSQEPISANE